jgi:hypothetical protein
LQPINDLTGDDPAGDFRIPAVRTRQERRQSYDDDGTDDEEEEYGVSGGDAMDADDNYLAGLDGATSRQRAIAKANARMGYSRGS